MMNTFSVKTFLISLRKKKTTEIYIFHTISKEKKGKFRLAKEKYKKKLFMVGCAIVLIF